MFDHPLCYPIASGLIPQKSFTDVYIYTHTCVYVYMCFISIHISIYLFVYIYIYTFIYMHFMYIYIYIFGYTSIYTSTILELGWKNTPNSACLPRHWVKVFFMDFLMVKQVFVVPWLFKRGRWKGQNKWTFSGWWFEILFPLFIPICSNIGFFGFFCSQFGSLSEFQQCLSLSCVFFGFSLTPKKTDELKPPSSNFDSLVSDQGTWDPSIKASLFTSVHGEFVPTRIHPRFCTEKGVWFFAAKDILGEKNASPEPLKYLKKLEVLLSPDSPMFGGSNTSNVEQFLSDLPWVVASRDPHTYNIIILVVTIPKICPKKTQM